MEEDVNDFHREDYYLAQVALEVRRGWISKDSPHPEMKDFILRFASGENNCMSNEEYREFRIQRSKSFWRALIEGGGK